MDLLEQHEHRRGVAKARDQLSGFIFSGVLEDVTRVLGDAAVLEFRQRLKLSRRLVPFLK
jgi:hypothetical protein